MKCFNPNTSDIDLIVVIKNEIHKDVKRELIAVLLETESVNDVEMSVVLEKDVKHFIYPTPFVLHYSKMYKNQYLNDVNYICGNNYDPDLAAHFTIIKYRGVCLCGVPIDKLFQSVPRSHYINSIVSDILQANGHIIEQPVYYTLNLCRVLYTLKSNAICSKKEGGEWMLAIIPNKYRDCINQALQVYSGQKERVTCDADLLISYAIYMNNEILQQLQQS